MSDFLPRAVADGSNGSTPPTRKEPHVSHAGGPGAPPHQQAFPPPAGPPPGLGAGKLLLGIAAAVVLVVAITVTVVLIAPWSDARGTDMSTDEDGNDVATLTLAFHPAWEIESQGKWSHPGELLYEDMQEPPDTVIWVGLDLDAGAAADLTMRYVREDGIETVWEAVGESAAPYAASPIVYRGGMLQRNPAVQGLATYVSYPGAPPADLNDLESRLALDGGDLFTNYNYPEQATWIPEPGSYLGFKTAAGTVGYVEVVGVRDSADPGNGHESEPFDLTVEITYLARP